MWKKLGLLTLLLALSLIVAGCRINMIPPPKETELPFETIEQSDWGGLEGQEPYSEPEPKLISINARQDISRLGMWISPTAIEQLRSLDFDQYFALVVFRGRKPYSGYDTIIKRVTRQGDKIVVYADFWAPSPHWPTRSEVTSPYHLIKVRREEKEGQALEVVLQSSIITPTPPFQ